MSTSRRVLFATTGSAGDLFPLVPLIRGMQVDGHVVHCATYRGLGLYLRSLGIGTLATGDGGELRVFDDPDIFTTRFDGWESWLRVLHRYTWPTLHADATRLQDWIETNQPDLVVASGFAVAARLAARRCDVPLVNVSIYPQHALAHRDERREFVRRGYGEGLGCGREAAGRRAPATRALRWGSPTDVLLHDPYLLDGLGVDPAQTVGFPYWDGDFGSPADLDRVDAFLRGGSTAVLVTMGSFIGSSRCASWQDALDAVRRLGLRAVVVGARSDALPDETSSADVLRVAFVPLSRIASRFAAIIHHGGLGTTIGAIRSGLPALVLPRAFDQPFNARIIEQVGAGCDGTQQETAAALAQVLAGDEMRARVAVVRAQLVDAEKAADDATAAIFERAGRQAA